MVWPYCISIGMLFCVNMGGISCKKVFTEAEMDRSAQGLGRTSRLDFSARDVDSIATAP